MWIGFGLGLVSFVSRIDLVEPEIVLVSDTNRVIGSKMLLYT